MNPIALIGVGMLAGTIQGVAGFGIGLTVMMFLPYAYGVTSSAAITGVVAIAINGCLIAKYHKYAKLKTALIAVPIFSACSMLAVSMSASLPKEAIKGVFGAVLIVIAVYNVFFKKTEYSKMSVPVMILFFIVSGFLDGAFSMGGPMIVLYFLSQGESHECFMGTSQWFFGLASVITSIFRIHAGVLTMKEAPAIGLCVIGIVFGYLLSRVLYKRLNPKMLYTITYSMVAVSGLINLITAIL